MPWYPWLLRLSLLPLILLSITAVRVSSEKSCGSDSGILATPAPSSGSTSTGSPTSRSTLVPTTLRAYTPTDSIDQEYHETHAAITADGTDTAEVPVGIAGPRHLLGRRVRILSGQEPAPSPYVPGSIWRIDDTGGMLRRRYAETGRVHLELRFVDGDVARRFGVRDAVVELLDP